MAYPSRIIGGAMSVPTVFFALFAVAEPRVERALSRWGSEGLGAVPVVMRRAASSPDVAAHRLARDTDSAVARARAEARAEATGPCYFDESTQQIIVEPSATGFSDAVLSDCLASALAQARYGTAESGWLAHLGEREAWVLSRERPGELEKVAVGRESAGGANLTPARAYWVSLARRELARAEDSAVAGSDGPGRAPASPSDAAFVRAALGLK